LNLVQQSVKLQDVIPIDEHLEDNHRFFL